MRRILKFVLPLAITLPLCGCASVQSIYNTHGPAALRIAHLSRALSVTFLTATVVMWVLLAIALKKRGGDLKEHLPIDAGGGNTWIAIGGLAIPLLVLSVFFFLGLELLADFPIHGVHGGMRPGAAMPKPDILVIGHQWWWEVRYLDGDPNQQFTTANEIHIPAHRAVNIEVQTADVIHSFWVPSLHGKVDLMPGHRNFIRVEASEPGNYFGQCASYCGEEHALMRILVVAQELPEYQAWLENERRPGVQPAGTMERAGEQAFVQGPCAQCHAVRGTSAVGRFGPELTHVGSRQYIASNTVPNNDGYLGGWITNAQAIKPGCRMPIITSYSGVQLRSLVKYLRQLK